MDLNLVTIKLGEMGEVTGISSNAHNLHAQGGQHGERLADDLRAHHHGAREGRGGEGGGGLVEEAVRRPRGVHRRTRGRHSYVGADRQ